MPGDGARGEPHGDSCARRGFDGVRLDVHGIGLGRASPVRSRVGRRRRLMRHGRLLGPRTGLDFPGPVPARPTNRIDSWKTVA